MSATYRVPALRKLVKVGRKILSAHLQSYPTTDRAAISADLIEKTIVHTISIERLWPKNKKDLLENLDTASIASIARCLIEIRRIYYYFRERGISEDEKELRFLVDRVHYSVETRIILEALQFDDKGSLLQAMNMSQSHMKFLLKRNKIVSCLNQKERYRFEHPRVGYLMKRATIPYLVSANFEAAIYKLLSNCIHSTSLGLCNYKLRATESPLHGLGLLIMTLETTILVVAELFDEYVKTRRSIGFGIEKTMP
jgi:hypothetical protein